ncbi:hypothetical protein QFC22_006545 [Naganishia vaughanmartiniae]|uniref:Uncharacterized protein n=1 Tax=Naganishia vaughanmartiniae TaxID=1424756 RepID=A0ACC2WIS7_9TREE|nr:hypothetical protein QFC22_006545 [Naganishia vaughanmartiniae]
MGRAGPKKKASAAQGKKAVGSSKQTGRNPIPQQSVPPPRPQARRRKGPVDGATANQKSYMDDNDPSAGSTLTQDEDAAANDANENEDESHLFESNSAPPTTLADANALAIAAENTQLQSSLAEALARLSQVVTDGEQYQRELEEERRARRQAEDNLRQEQVERENLSTARPLPAVMKPTITRAMRGSSRILNARYILGLQIPENAQSAQLSPTDLLKENMWSWLQANARMVIAWGQTHQLPTLRIEPVPCWQTMDDDRRGALMNEFEDRVRHKPSAKALFYYGDANIPDEGVSIYHEDWIFKDMMMTVMNDITDTDTKYIKLNRQSDLPSDASSLSTWPPPRATQLIVPVVPRPRPEGDESRPPRAQIRSRRRRAVDGAASNQETRSDEPTSVRQEL